MEFISTSIEETKEIAQKIAEKLKEISREHLDKGIEKALVVGLSGELGAGKTTFMKYLAKEFGIEEEVQSPTFIIMRIFEIPSIFQEAHLNHSKLKKLIHIDAYRLDSGKELLNLGWEELTSHSGNLICMEWPERVEEIGRPDIMIRFAHGESSENTRTISFT